MYFTVFISFWLFAIFFFKQSLSTSNPEPISLHADVFDEEPHGSSSAQISQQPPRKISTGIMKPISSPGSPRMHDGYTQMGNRGHKYAKGISHTAIMANHLSTHPFPKITIRPGKKDVSISSTFIHPGLSENAKPFEYMHNQQKDSAEDITRPAWQYKLGLRKVDDKSPELREIKESASEAFRNHYYPKAALFHSLKGDSSASSKHPTIDVDPGKLHGNLIITAFGSQSPPKQQAQTQTQSITTNPSNARPRSPSPNDRNDHVRQRIDLNL